MQFCYTRRLVSNFYHLIFSGFVFKCVRNLLINNGKSILLANGRLCFFAFYSGNLFIHQLTSTLGYSHLKIELLNFDGIYGFAEYDFSVDDESNQYMIHATWKTGNIDGIAVKFILTFK